VCELDARGRQRIRALTHSKEFLAATEIEASLHQAREQHIKKRQDKGVIVMKQDDIASPHHLGDLFSAPSGLVCIAQLGIFWIDRPVDRP